MNLRRTLSAGLLDSGAASLATFSVGLYAASVLDPTSLGAYALFLAAFSTLMVVSAQLVFLPAEVFAARRAAGERLGVLATSLPLGALPAIGAGLLIPPVALVVPKEVPGDVVWALLLTATPCTMLSPVQDHVRAMLHVADRSWRAAAVSGVQLSCVAAALLALAALDAPAAWRPFMALGAANLVSSIVGICLCAGAWRPGGSHPPTWVELLRSGRWLLLAGIAPNVGAFGAMSCVAHLASAQVLGYAEGARILARPVVVLGQGIMSVLGPRLVRAGSERDAATSRRLDRVVAMVVGLSGVAYLLIAGFDWMGNPFARLVPAAYAVPGLVAVSILVNLLDRVAGVGARFQLLGATRERAVAIVESLASFGRVAGGLTAPLTGPFAVPLGFFVMVLIRRSWLRRLARRLYLHAGLPVSDAQAASTGIARLSGHV